MDTQDYEVIEQAIDFLTMKKDCLWAEYYGQWNSRSTMTSWEECYEYSCYLMECAEYQNQIDALTKLLP